jgi:hypothetical protein
MSATRSSRVLLQSGIKIDAWAILHTCHSIHQNKHLQHEKGWIELQHWIPLAYLDLIMSVLEKEHNQVQ